MTQRSRRTTVRCAIAALAIIPVAWVLSICVNVRVPIGRTHAIGFGAGSFIYYSGAAMDGRPLTFQFSRRWHGFTLGKSESEFKYGRRGMIAHISHWPLGS